MEVKLSGRPLTNPFNLSPGQTFLHNGKLFLAIPYARLEGGKTINAVSLATGALFSLDESIEVELVSGTFVEGDLSVIEEDL